MPIREVVVDDYAQHGPDVVASRIAGLGRLVVSEWCGRMRLKIRIDADNWTQVDVCFEDVYRAWQAVRR
jgi:hypothetical protein